jgi:hypothetical protein
MRRPEKRIVFSYLRNDCLNRETHENDQGTNYRCATRPDNLYYPVPWCAERNQHRRQIDCTKAQYVLGLAKRAQIAAAPANEADFM